MADRVLVPNLFRWRGVYWITLLLFTKTPATFHNALQFSSGEKTSTRHSINTVRCSRGMNEWHHPPFGIASCCPFGGPRYESLNWLSLFLHVEVRRMSQNRERNLFGSWFFAGWPIIWNHTIHPARSLNNNRWKTHLSHADKSQFCSSIFTICPFSLATFFVVVGSWIGKIQNFLLHFYFRYEIWLATLIYALVLHA